MKISELGEFKLIELISKTIGKTGGGRLLMGIGDDAACWKANGLQLATTDTLIEGVHFNLKYITWAELGWKAMAVNLSDIAAMGGRPLYALVSLGVPADTEVENVTELYRGMVEQSKKFKVRIVGGDSVASPVIAITVTLIGETKDKTKPLRRSAAKAGDMIAVTGTFGASAGGLAMIRRGLSLEKKAAAALMEAHVKPTPRLKEGLILARNGVRAAIDVSDGLLGDLEKLCLASEVGARLNSERIPIHPAVIKSFGNEALTLALTGGEDYELIFTAPQKIADKCKHDLPCAVTVIGKIVKGNGVKVLDEDGNEFSWGSSGWDHFAKGTRL